MLALFTWSSERGLSFWEKLAAWYEQSALHELLTYLEERYFSLEFGLYENFSVDGGLGETVRNVIIAIAVALIAVSVMNAYTRQTLGGFIRRLIAEDCLSPDRAKTLSELGYFRSTSIRRALTRGTTLRLVVRRTDDAESPSATPSDGTDATENIADEAVETDSENADANGTEAECDTNESPASPYSNDSNRVGQGTRIDFLTARFYVPEELKYRAEIRFRTKGSSWWTVALTALLSVVVAALLCRLLPDAVAFADNLMTWLSPS